MKILVIDADPRARDALTVGLQLQWQDCEVLTAAGGEPGEQAFFDHLPEVVLLHLALPRWAAAGLLGLGLRGALLVVLEPVLGAGRGVWGQRLAWPLALALLAADAAAALLPGAPAAAALAVNNAVLVLAVVGVTNLWAQSGLKARDAAVLAGALALYDVVATAWLPLTDALLGRLAGLPFAPLVAWPAGQGGGLGIGLGDLLLAAVVPLALRKAYGRRAGGVAAALAVATLAGLLALLDLGLVRATISAMVALGPLTVAQYLFWRRRGRERTTRQYLQAEPRAAIHLVGPPMSAGPNEAPPTRSLGGDGTASRAPSAARMTLRPRRFATRHQGVM